MATAARKAGNGASNGSVTSSRSTQPSNKRPLPLSRPPSRQAAAPSGRAPLSSTSPNAPLAAPSAPSKDGKPARPTTAARTATTNVHSRATSGASAASSASLADLRSSRTAAINNNNPGGGQLLSPTEASYGNDASIQSSSRSDMDSSQGNIRVVVRCRSVHRASSGHVIEHCPRYSRAVLSPP